MNTEPNAGGTPSGPIAACVPTAPAHGRWIDLDVVVAALAITADTSAGALRSTLAALGLADVRPRRLVVGDGPGELALPGEATTARQERVVVDAIAGAGRDRASVAWTVGALVDWLERSGLDALTPEPWRRRAGERRPAR